MDINGFLALKKKEKISFDLRKLDPMFGKGKWTEEKEFREVSNSSK